MPSSAIMPHRPNYARLRPAATIDAAAVAALHGLVASGAAFSEGAWHRLIRSRAAGVTLALEGGAVIGVCAKLHKPGSAVANILWIGVEPSARGRGVGHLLMENVVEQARAEGAAVLTVGIRPESVTFAHLLENIGFKRADSCGAQSGRYCKSLWNPRRLASFSLPDVPYHPHVGDTHASICALMMAMGSVDTGVILSGRVETVLHHEVFGEEVLDPRDQCRRLAGAASRRGFEALILGESPEPAAQPVKPELLVGYLSRGHVPMIHAGFERLHGQGHRRWLVIAGFDGHLFRLVDPDAQLGNDAVTIGEMRAALAAAPPLLIIGKSPA